MWCPNCGSEVQGNPSFCMHCGCDLRPYAAAFQAAATPAATPTPAPAPTPAPQPTPAPTQTYTQPSSSSGSSSFFGGGSSSSSGSDPRENTTAVRRARAFMRLLDSKGLSYTYMHDTPGDDLYGVIAIPLGGGELSFPSMKFYVDFDFNNSGEGDSVHIVVYEIASYSQSSLSAAYEAINGVANRKRFVRFYLDKDLDLVATCDTWISEENATDLTFELLMTMASVINNTYTDFQKARWS